MDSAYRDAMAILIVACIAASSVIGAGAVVTQASPGANETNQTRDTLEMPTLDGPDTYAGNHTWLRLWSGDSDDPALSEPLGEGAWGFEASLAAASDAAFHRPLAAPAEWNAQNVRQYADRSLGTSVHPAGIDVTDGEFVRDAFVAVYAIDPSTTLHTADGTTRYVAQSGSVHVVSDFRIPTGRETGTGSVRTTVEAIDDAEIAVSLLNDGRRLDRGTGARNTLQFLGLSGTERLHVEAEIRAELRIETRRCTQWNESAGSCNGDWNVSHADRTISETVDTTRSVTVNELGATERRRIVIGGRQPSVTQLSVSSGTRNGSEREPFGTSTRRGTGGIALDPAGHWSSIQVGPNTSLGSHLRYYSRSPAEWRTMVVADAEGTDRTASRIRPLELHAYPGPDGLRPSTEASDSGAIEVRAVDGEVRSGPRLGSTIDLAVPSQYRSPDEIAFTVAGLGPLRAQSATIHGIVPGRERTVSLPEPTVARPVDLDLSLDPENETHTRLVATVRDAWTGRLLSNGHVEVSGSHHPVTNGTVSVLIEEPPRRIEARYRPESWLTADRIYRPAGDAVERSTSTPDLAAVIDVALWMALSLLPISLAVLGLDRATGGRLFGITDTDS